MDNKLTVNFYIKSSPREKYAVRFWQYVPRVGECVLLGAGGKFEADHNGDAMFMIHQICWGVESKMQASYDKQAINVYIEHIK